MSFHFNHLIAIALMSLNLGVCAWLVLDITILIVIQLFFSWNRTPIRHCILPTGAMSWKTGELPWPGRRRNSLPIQISRRHISVFKHLIMISNFFTLFAWHGHCNKIYSFMEKKIPLDWIVSCTTTGKKTFSNLNNLWFLVLMLTF